MEQAPQTTTAGYVAGQEVSSGLNTVVHSAQTSCHITNTQEVALCTAYYSSAFDALLRGNFRWLCISACSLRSRPPGWDGHG